MSADAPTPEEALLDRHAHAERRGLARSGARLKSAGGALIARHPLAAGSLAALAGAAVTAQPTRVRPTDSRLARARATAARVARRMALTRATSAVLGAFDGPADLPDVPAEAP